MSRKIKNLQEEVQFLAICNQIEIGNIPNDDLLINSGSSRNFNWEKSPQGNKFWGNISDGVIIDISVMKLFD